MIALIEGAAKDITPLEGELIELVRKNYEHPARLIPSDLDPVRDIVGEGALDYALVIGSFHFINRIADLLHVDLEALPRPLRRFEFLRRLTVRIASMLMSKLDLENRTYETSYEEALNNLGREPGVEWASLKPRPRLIESFQMSLEERDIRSSLDRETLAGINRTVEEALPASIDEAEGFHARPEDPVEEFAFVGTRYAYRVTKDMIRALRGEGYDDLGILDLAIAVAEANSWARLHRLLGLEPTLFYISP